MALISPFIVPLIAIIPSIFFWYAVVTYFPVRENRSQGVRMFLWAIWSLGLILFTFGQGYNIVETICYKALSRDYVYVPASGLIPYIGTFPASSFFLLTMVLCCAVLVGHSMGGPAVALTLIGGLLSLGAAYTGHKVHNPPPPHTPRPLPFTASNKTSDDDSIVRSHAKWYGDTESHITQAANAPSADNTHPQAAPNVPELKAPPADNKPNDKATQQATDTVEQRVMEAAIMPIIKEAAHQAAQPHQDGPPALEAHTDAPVSETQPQTYAVQPHIQREQDDYVNDDRSQDQDDAGLRAATISISRKITENSPNMVVQFSKEATRTSYGYTASFRQIKDGWMVSYTILAQHRHRGSPRASDYMRGVMFMPFSSSSLFITDDNVTFLSIVNDDKTAQNPEDGDQVLAEKKDAVHSATPAPAVKSENDTPQAHESHAQETPSHKAPAAHNESDTDTTQEETL